MCGCRWPLCGLSAAVVGFELVVIQCRIEKGGEEMGVDVTAEVYGCSHTAARTISESREI